MNGTASVGLSEEQITSSNNRKELLGNNTFLRHNILMGKPMTQWRVHETSEDMDHQANPF